jgi:hypothetical protein
MVLNQKAVKSSPKYAILSGITKGSIRFTQDVLNTGVDLTNWMTDSKITKFNYAPDYSKNPLENSGYVLGKYFTGFAGSGAVLKVAGVTGKALAFSSVGSGAVVNAALTQAEDRTMTSHLIESYPGLEGWVPSIIVSKPDDTVLEAKGRAALESMFVDTMLLGTFNLGTGLFKSFKGMKAAKALKSSVALEEKIVAQADAIPTTATEVPPIVEERTSNQAFKEAIDSGYLDGSDIPKEGIPPKNSAHNYEHIGPNENGDDVFKNTETGEKLVVPVKKIPPVAKAPRDNVRPIRPDIEIPQRVLTPEEVARAEQTGKLFSNPTEEVIKNIEGSKSGKELMEKISHIDDPGLKSAWDELKSGRMPVAEAQDLAAGMFQDKAKMKALLGRKPGTAVNGVELLAMGMELETKWKVLVAARDGMKAGGEAEKAFFKTSLAQFRATSASVLGGASEMGRGMRFFQEAFQAAKSQADQVDMLDEYIKIAGDDADTVAHYIDKIIKQGGGMKEVDQALKRGGALNKLGDVLYEMWMNLLLSRPSTHVKNLISNTLKVSAAVPETLIAATISKTHDILGVANKDKVHFSDAYAILKGYKEGLGEGMSSAFGIFFKERIPEGMTVKMEELRERAIKTDMDGFIASVVNAFGYTVNISGRIHQLANRDLIARKVSSKDWAKQYDNFIKNPPSDVRLAADKFAQKQTFTSPLSEVPMGEIGQRVSDLVGVLPMGRVITPFIRINTNLAGATLEYLPVIGAASSKIRGAITQGGAARHEALAKMALGGGILAYGAMQYADGDVTARGPENFRMDRSLNNGKGYMPRSLVLEDGTHLPIDFFPPFSSVFFAGADIAEMHSYLDVDNEHKIDNYVMGSMSIIADKLTPDFLTEGMPLYFDFIKNVQNNNLKGEAFRKASANFMATVTGKPFWQTFLKRNIDPIKRDTSPEEALKGLDGLIRGSLEETRNQFMDSVGMGKNLPEMLNIFGEPLKMIPGVSYELLSPFGGPEEDKVRLELQRLGMHSQMYNPIHEGKDSALNISMPERQARYNEMIVDLSPKEYNKFIKFAAGLHESFDGQTLYKTIENIMQDETINNVKPDGFRDEIKKKAIKKAISGYRQTARGLMIEDISVATKLRDSIIDRAAQTGESLTKEDISLEGIEPQVEPGEL